MSKKKEKLSDTRKLGKYTGYDLIDGQYHVAPMYVEMFTRWLNQYRAIEDVLAAVTRHCTKDFQLLQQEKRRIWDTMGEDFGVDFKSGEWNYQDGRIIPVPKEEVK